MKTITFSREKISTHCKVSRDIITEASIRIGNEGIDFIEETLTAQLEAFVWSRLSEKRTITNVFKRPSFLEWLFRKKREVKIEIDVKDLLLNPPVIESTKRIYEVNIVK